MEGNVSSESPYKSSVLDIVSLLKSYFHQSIAIIIFLLIWEAAPRLGLVNILFISPPSVVFASMVNLILSGELIHQVVSSLIRVCIGFGLALLVALPLGFLLGGWFKGFETSVNPLLQIFGQANPFVGIEFDRVKLGGVLTVIGDGDFAAVHDPLANALDLFALIGAGGHGINAPMNEHAEAGLAPPVHARVPLLRRFGGGHLLGLGVHGGHGSEGQGGQGQRQE